MAIGAGFEMHEVEERLSDIRTHYDKLAARLAMPDVNIDDTAASSIADSLARWQAALADGSITWACFVAKKPI